MAVKRPRTIRVMFTRSNTFWSRVIRTFTMTASGSASQTGLGVLTTATSGVTASPDNNVVDTTTTYWWGSATIP